MFGPPWENTAQWSCVVKDACGWTYVDLKHCTLEPEQPQSADDCAEGEVFTCMTAFSEEYSKRITLNCECVPLPPEAEVCPCPTDKTGKCAPEPEQSVEVCRETREATCQCAVTCILK